MDVAVKGDARHRSKTSDTRVKFPRRLLMLGCGSIGQGILSLLMRHTDITPDRMHIITGDSVGKEVAKRHGLSLEQRPLDPKNYKEILKRHLSSGDFLLNLSVNVSSLDLVAYCQTRGIAYLDTSLERWPGFESDTSLPIEQRTNYALRQELKKMRRKYPSDGPTAVVSHGANPGLISHFIKAALINVARDTNLDIETPHTRDAWARLMRLLNVRVVQVAEHDTQVSPIIKAHDEFINTWSIDGFLSEIMQPVELGWGTHEIELPHDGHEHVLGNKAAVYLGRPGALTQVRSWTPREGTYHGFLISHDEAISTADYFTVLENDSVAFRPTVMYAYHPSDDAVLSLRSYAGNNWRWPRKKKIIVDEITRGSDELGALLLGHRRRAYWFGSDLSIAQARELTDGQNATGLQVTAGAFAALVWVLENPHRGILEPEDLDYRRILQLAEPYLGTVHGKYTSWTPLRDRKDPLFPEDISAEDPWQFKNFRVS